MEPIFVLSIVFGMLMLAAEGTVYGGQLTAHSPAQLEPPAVSLLVVYTVMPLYAERYCPTAVAELMPRIRFSSTLVPSSMGMTSSGHAANSQFGPVLPTEEPSGHILASCGHTCAPLPALCPENKYHPPTRRTRTTITHTIVELFIDIEKILAF